MNLLWKNFINTLKNNQGIFSVGFGDSAGKGISAIFWFIMAGILGPEQYGEIHYLLAIAGMGQIFSLIATSQTMTVYTAKKIKIESTLIVISLISGSVAFAIILMTSLRIEVAFLVLAFILIELTSGILLGNRRYQTYAKFFLTQKILLFVLGLGLFFQFGIPGIIAGIALSHIPYIFVIFKELRKTKIDFSLPKTGRVVITIYNLLGQEVTTLINERLDYGFHTVTWQGTDRMGRPVGSGVYFSELRTRNFRQTKKMLLLK